MNMIRYIVLHLIPGLFIAGMSLYTITLIYQFATSPSNPYHMKPSTFISIGSISVVVILGLLGCAAVDKERTHTEYAVMKDITDSLTPIPSAQEIVDNIGIGTSTWNSVNFSFGNFSDVSLEPHVRISLSKPPSRLSASEFTRKREVETFKTKLTALLDSARNDTTGRPNSSIYLPMVEELTRLSNCSADRKVLVMYTDLMENFPGLSFYSPQTFALIRTDPDKVKALLAAQSKLPDLTGIEVYIIHQPKNAKDDAVFRTVGNFYSMILSEAGATVTVSANLTNQ